MRKYFGWLILLGAAVLLGGCAERHYDRYYYGRGGYYDGYGYSHHHDRHHDDDRYRHDDRH